VPLGQFTFLESGGGCSARNWLGGARAGAGKQASVCSPVSGPPFAKSGAEHQV